MNKDSQLMMDVSLAHELKMAFRRNGWKSSDIKNLSKKDTLSKVLKFLEENKEELRNMKVLVKKPRKETCICSIDSIITSEDFSGDKDLMQESLKKDVQKVLSKLTDLEIKVTKLYFGIDCESLHPEEIGEALGLNEEEVNFIKEKAINHLRESKMCYCILKEYIV